MSEQSPHSTTKPVQPRANSADYHHIFLSGAPLIDLRAPCEYTQGAFPNAINLPLMTDQERQKVGTRYKQQGQQSAIKLGHQLVSGDTRQQRLQGWIAFAKAHPQHGYLYCFRGGLRSQTVQQWLADEGINLPLIEGGYKALRRFLIDTTERLTDSLPFYIIGGLTGSAKTTLLTQLNHHIDLEALANHRGSTFGKQLTAQPSQITFENLLAIELLKLEERTANYLVLEDEGRLIGSRSTPLDFFNKMSTAPLIMLQETLQNRVEHIHQEYVVDMYNKFLQLDAQNGMDNFSEYLLNSLDKVRKRLGGERHMALRQLMLNALAHQSKTTTCEGHYSWINQLLVEYYDPMYQYQLTKKQHRVIFQGNRGEVTDYVNSLANKI